MNNKASFHYLANAYYCLLVQQQKKSIKTRLKSNGENRGRHLFD